MSSEQIKLFNEISKLSTEQRNPNSMNIDIASISEILHIINNEDKTVPYAIEKVIDKIEPLVIAIVEKMKIGGRLFYIGAGTSGRLGIVDASECPPTFGVTDDWVVGIIAGGDKAIRTAVEYAEDDITLAWKDLQSHEINENE